MSLSPKVFIDTNIFVYQFDSDEPTKQSQAQTLLKQLLTNDDACISNQVIQEFLNVVIKKQPTVLSPTELKEIVNFMLSPICAHIPGPDFYVRSLNLHATHALSWYDTLIIQAALDLNCDILYSEDLQAGQRFGNLIIKNPFNQ